VLMQVVQPVPMMISEASTGFPNVPLTIDEIATAGVVRNAEAQLTSLADALIAEGVATSIRVEIDHYVPGALLDTVRAHDIDAIALTTHGRGGSRLILGSVADKILRASQLPLLTFRPETAASAKDADAPVAVPELELMF
jgi:nucleotide-binding universal stress UspA family protein